MQRKTNVLKECMHQMVLFLSANFSIRNGSENGKNPPVIRLHESEVLFVQAQLVLLLIHIELAACVFISPHLIACQANEADFF